MASRRFPLLPTQPFSLIKKKRYTPYLRAFYGLLTKLNLKHVKRMEFSFDPFHPEIKSIRNLNLQLTSRKIIRTNPECTYRTNIATDRSEPLFKVRLDTGRELHYKTSLLTEVEVLEHLKWTTDQLDVDPETAIVK